MTEQWGKWKNHDGKGCPAELKVGILVAAYFESGFYDEKRYIGSGNGGSWDAKNSSTHQMILRYRIRKPDALIQMIEQVEDLPVVKLLEVTA